MEYMSNSEMYCCKHHVLHSTTSASQELSISLVHGQTGGRVSTCDKLVKSVKSIYEKRKVVLDIFFNEVRCPYNHLTSTLLLASPRPLSLAQPRPHRHLQRYQNTHHPPEFLLTQLPKYEFDLGYTIISPSK